MNGMKVDSVRLTGKTFPVRPMHQWSDGRLVEYRRRSTDPVVLGMDHRVLCDDGIPFDGRWYRVSDEHLLSLQLDGGQHILDDLMESN